MKILKKTLIVLSMLSPFVLLSQNNSSIEFTGANEYVSYSPQINIPYFPITIQTHVKLPVGYASNPAFSVFKSDESSGAYAGFWMAIYPSFIEISYGDGQGEGNIYRRTKTADHSIPEDQWVNIACVIRSTYDMSIYLDGVELSGNYSGTGGAYVSSLGNPTVTGYALGSADQEFSTGKIDNLHIWDIELSLNEITRYMNCPPIGNEGGLVALYKYEEGSGNTIEDLSVHNYNGSFINSPIWSNDTPTESCSLSVINLDKNEEDKEIVKITNILGQEIEYLPNTVLIYQYSDGSCEKIFSTE